MLGHFYYSPQVLEGAVMVEMRSGYRGPMGVLHIPPAVSEVTAGTEYEGIKTGETASLIIALGLGLILAGLAGTYLAISGERSAWDESWGTLLEMPGGPQ